jgi:hypothetical protein
MSVKTFRIEISSLNWFVIKICESRQELSFWRARSSTNIQITKMSNKKFPIEIPLLNSFEMYY